MKKTPTSPWAILAVTSLAVFAVMLDALVLFVAFPAIELSFSAVSSAQLSWVLNGYTIVYGALLVPAGRFADRLGRKRVFLAGATLFTLASVLCGLAPTPALLIAARVLQAVGGAMLTPTSLALTLAAFPQAQRSVAVSLWGAVGALAVVAGPPLGSLIVQYIGWPGIFFLNLPVGLAAVLIGRAIIPESRDETPGRLPDLLGVAMLIGGSAAAGVQHCAERVVGLGQRLGRGRAGCLARSRWWPLCCARCASRCPPSISCCSASARSRWPTRRCFSSASALARCSLARSFF